MAIKERGQNPVIGDQIKLRLFVFNSNNAADFESIQTVEIYYLDRQAITDENPDGRRLVESFDGSGVTTVDTGQYLLTVNLEDPRYVIGEYLDVWTVTAMSAQPPSIIEQVFEVYPALWYTTPMPVVYDFAFHFQPNKFRKGSKQFLNIEIVPNVPTAGDLRRYYENLAIVSDLSLSMELRCGDCVPAEYDLRLVHDHVPVDFREKRFGYFQLDTTELDCGIYNLTFFLSLGGNNYVSDRYQIQVYD